MSENKDRRIDVYLQKATRWQAEMTELRRIVLSFPVQETFKWRQPCYSTQHGNILIISSFKSAATLNFMRGALLKDPENLLVQPGEHTRSGRFMQFTSVDDITLKEPVIRSYIHEAIDISTSGLKVDFSKDREIEPPEEFVTVLDNDPEFAAAFENLTPGRQRGYLIFFNGAKQSKTRSARIAKYRDHILQGHGMHDR